MRALPKLIPIGHFAEESKIEEVRYVEGPTEAELVHDVEGEDCVVCLSNRPICIVKCARSLCGANPQVKCPKCRSAAEKILRIH